MAVLPVWGDVMWFHHVWHTLTCLHAINRIDSLVCKKIHFLNYWMLTQDILGIHQKAGSSVCENINILMYPFVFCFVVHGLCVCIILVVWVSGTPQEVISTMERMWVSCVGEGCARRGQEVLNWFCYQQRDLGNSNCSDSLLSLTAVVWKSKCLLRLGFNSKQYP